MKRSTATATALGLIRNESGSRFPHAEDPAVLEDLRAEVFDVLASGQWEHGWQVHDLESATDVELEHFVERGLMTPGFAEGTGEGRGFAVYGEGQASIEVNGVDHLRVLGFRAGESGQQHGGQDPNDGNHHEKFNQGESVPALIS